MNTSKKDSECQTIPLFAVYVIWCRCTNQFYVGVTRREVEQRIREHKHGKRQFLDCEIQKNGWEGNWDWWIVEDGVPSDQISEREQHWVKFFGCVYPDGYNRTIGGIKYFEFSNEALEKISKANRGKPSPNKGIPHTDEEKANLSAKMKGENNPMYGKHHTPESKEKNRQSHLGKHHTPETIASISAAVKGENHPMYGKHHTPESKEKNRQSHLGKPSSRKGKHHKAESIEKIRQSRLGTHHTKESNEKNRQAHLGKKGYWAGKKRPNMSGENHPLYGKPAWNKGIPCSEEQKAILREKARKEPSKPSLKKILPLPILRRQTYRIYLTQ